MKFTHLVMVGVGGTGSIFLELAARLLAYHPNGTKDIVLIDGDKYEAKNLERQLFDPSLVGKNKAESAALRLKGLGNVSTIGKYIDQESFVVEMMNVKGFCDGNPLIVLSVDNHATRHQVIKALDELPIKNFCVLLPGNELDYGRTGVYLKHDGVVVGTHPFDVYPDIKEPKDRIPGGCAKQAPSTPQLISANAGAAYASILTLQAMLDNKPWYFEVHFDCRKFKFLAQGDPVQEETPAQPAVDTPSTEVLKKTLKATKREKVAHV